MDNRTFIIGLDFKDLQALQAGDVLTMPGSDLGIANCNLLLVYRSAADNLAAEVARLREIGNANANCTAGPEPKDRSIDPEQWANKLLLCKMAGPPEQDWGLLGNLASDPPAASMKEFRRVKADNRREIERELEALGYRPLKRGDPREAWSGDGLETWMKGGLIEQA